MPAIQRVSVGGEPSNVAGTITFHQANATRSDEHLLGRDSSQSFILPVDSPPDSVLRDNARGAARGVALAARSQAVVDPSLVLEGVEPRLIDEWQREPEIWNHRRRAATIAGAAGISS